jgi:hypothetical protein
MSNKVNMTGFANDANSPTIRAEGLIGETQVFIDYDKLTGTIVDSTFRESSDLFKDMDKQARQILVFKVPVDLAGDSYTVRQYNQMNEWHDKLKAAEKVLSEMDRLVTSEDWMYNQLGQTTGSIIDSLNEVRIALDARLSNQ